MKGCIVYLLSFFLYQQSYSQIKNFIIQGKVLDASSKENLQNATVQLMRLNDSVVIRKAISEQNGFVMNHVPAGNYQLLVSYVGYKDSSFKVHVTGKDNVYNLGNLLLNSSAGQLAEVVIKAVVTPMIIKNDTIIFNPGAFPTRPNATVEELLRKLPGIEVDKDGNISYQGERVDKIYVDGKEFFLNDPRLATQNLLADMILRIEAFDEKSERARMTGIPDNNPGKIINLRLKPDKKKGMFGDAEAVYASEERYGFRATNNYFKGNAYFMAVGNSNNGAGSQGNPGLLNSKENSLTVNYRNSWKDKLEYGVSYSLANNGSRNTIFNNRQTFFSDSSLLQSRGLQSTNQINKNSLGISFNYAIDSFNSINSSVQISMNKGESNQSDEANTVIEKTGYKNLLNNALSGNHTKSNSLNGNLNLNYNHRFRKEGRYVGLNLNNGNNKTNSNSDQQSVIRFYSGNAVTDSLQRKQQSVQNGNGANLSINISYYEPLGMGQALDIGYSLSNNNNSNDQRNYNYNPVTGIYDDLDTLVSNAFENKNKTHQFSLGYSYFKNSFRYQVSVSAAKNLQQNKTKSADHNNIEQQAYTFLPIASVVYSISKRKTLLLSYNGSNRQPSINQLQPIPDYSNPLLVRLGNPNLKQEFNTSVMVSYRQIDPGKAKIFFWQMQYRNTSGKIVNSTMTTAQGVQEQKYLNVNGNYSINSIINYGMPIGKGKLKGSAKSSANFRFSQNVSVVNGLKNTAKVYNWLQNLTLNLHSGESFFMNAAASFNWSRSVYSIQTIMGYSFFTHNYTADILYKISGDWIISSNFNLTANSSRADLPGSHSAVWNAFISKRLLKDNTGELKFTVYDILNRSLSFHQRAVDNYIETTETEVLKRVFMLSFVYRFRINKL